MIVGGRGVILGRGAGDGVLSSELLTVDDGGSVRLEVGVEDSPLGPLGPLGEDGFEPRPIEDGLSSEPIDPDSPDRGRLDPATPDPETLDPAMLDDERLDPATPDPDTLEDPAVLDGRPDGAGDEREVPLVPTEEPEPGESGLPLALLKLDEGGLVELRLLPTVGLDTPELGLHGCWNGVGASGGATGEVGLCTERGA
jgi:hypothetical protein